MTKTEIYANDGHDFEISCKASAPIKKCIFQFEKSEVDVPDGCKNISKSYVCTGYENGECGVRIKGKWDMQGSVSCIVHLQEDDQVLTSNATIIVDTASGAALLEFNGHGGHLLQYNESQLMHLACRAQYGTFSRAKLLIGKQFMEFL